MSTGIVCGIYKITSPSDKIYIGQSENIYRRWKLYKGGYINSIKTYKGSYPQHLFNSIKKYGAADHRFEILQECESDMLNKLEMYWICFFNSYKTPHGMNCTIGGDGVKGYEWSNDARLKQSIKLKGKIPWNAGLKLTTEHIEKSVDGVKKAWARRKASPEYYSEEKINSRKPKTGTDFSIIRKEMWKRMKSNEKYETKEEKERRSLIATLREKNKREKGVKKSEETINRHREATRKMWENKKLNGIKPFSDKALENIRNGNKRKLENPSYNSNEARQKRSESSKKHWEKRKNELNFYSAEQIEKRKNVAKKSLATKRNKNNTKNHE